MIIGVPKEIKDGERRVGLTPEGARALIAAGHTVKVQASAGAGSGFAESEYSQVGATVVSSARAAFDADLVVKVKEIQPNEWRELKPDSALFCFQHLQSDGEMARELLARRITAIAYETVEDARGQLPLLAPMSAIAGELAITIGANALMAPHGGSGVMLRDASVLVVGMGVVGQAAARTARALGAKVLCFGRAAQGEVRAATELAEHLANADLVVGAANTRGARSPRMISCAEVARMRPGSVIVDVCIDGGGIAETSRPTTHAEPMFVEAGVIHYCVPNMPAAVPRSATRALCTATLPYVEALARLGIWGALRADAGLAAGLHMAGGQLTHEGVAAALGLPCTPADALLHRCGLPG
ncbi:MAG: alanine dehydrogenase [Betaproteobacteria bacterium]|nr:alanine dehydrogenase [Betaproteobacteria bacterium]